MSGHSHRHLKPPKHLWREKSPSVVPADVQAALRQAIVLKHVAAGDLDDLLWIMAQKSGAQVNATDPASTTGGVPNFYVRSTTYTRTAKTTSTTR